MTAALENGEDSALNQASERVLQQHRATSKKELCDPVEEAITAAVDFHSAFAEESDRAAAVLAHACHKSPPQAGQTQPQSCPRDTSST